MVSGSDAGAVDPLQLVEVAVVPSGPLVGVCKAPTSKSLSNRLLLMAALADGTSRLVDVLRSDDTAAMLNGLRALGAGMDDDGAGTVDVAGTGGHLQQPTGVVAAGLSGTTLRWLAAAALLVRGTVVLDGEPPLRRRPILPLLRALEGLGATIATEGGHPPLSISSSGLHGGRVRIDAAESSQFATSLLLVSPYAEADVELEVANLGAVGYVDLTLEAMVRWGAQAGRSHSDTGAADAGSAHYIVSAGRHYLGREEVVEYDASAAGHLFALAMATGGSVTVSNVAATRQPDAELATVFAAMGATVGPAPDGGVTVSRPESMRGTDVDISLMPDQLPALAVLGALADGTMRLRNVSVARGHETDRVAATVHELRKLGADVEEDGDGLVVRGGRPLTGATVETYDDHRMAMALSSLAAVVPGVVIRHPGCVRKTYPAYWADAAGLGMRLRPVS
jgi:3-phosphoshikimate 1-carboxyvinyltransferase